NASRYSPNHRLTSLLSTATDPTPAAPPPPRPQRGSAGSIVAASSAAPIAIGAICQPGMPPATTVAGTVAGSGGDASPPAPGGGTCAANAAGADGVLQQRPRPRLSRLNALALAGEDRGWPGRWQGC